MTLILASRPNVYTGNPLDRAGDRATTRTGSTPRWPTRPRLFVPVWRARNLVHGAARRRRRRCSCRRGGRRRCAWRAGPGRSSACRAARPCSRVDLSAADDPLPLLPERWAGSRICAAWPAGCRAGRRGGAGACPRADALARPPPLLRRLRRGLRAAQRRARDGLPACGAAAFPAHRPGRDHAGASRRPRACSAIRSVSRTRTMYSTLAGFVEPGESLEEAVRARGAGGERHPGRRACAITAASPGRSRPASCSASMPRR